MDTTVTDEFGCSMFSSGTWANGEHYAHDMMGDFNNWVTGFLESWKSAEATMAMRWGMSDFKTYEQTRPQFVGREIHSGTRAEASSVSGSRGTTGSLRVPPGCPAMAPPAPATASSAIRGSRPCTTIRGS